MSNTIPAAAQPLADVSPQFASLQELEAICGDSDFVLEQMKSKATVAQATNAYAKRLKAENDQLRATHEADLKRVAAEAAAEAQESAQAAADAAASPSPLPVDGDTSADMSSGDFVADPIATFTEKVEQAMEKQSAKIPEDQKRMKAIRAVARQNPELHQSFLSATNSTAKKKRLLAEKYE